MWLCPNDNSAFILASLVVWFNFSLVIPQLSSSSVQLIAVLAWNQSRQDKADGGKEGELWRFL